MSHSVATSSAEAIPAATRTQRRVRVQGEWRGLEEAVVGLGHRLRDLPCQDAARAVVQPRAAAVLADGAGSSAVSELGAQKVVQGLARLIHTLEKPIAEQLDHETASDVELRSLALLFVKHAVGLLRDLAAEHRRELRDFRCTLLLFVSGRERHLWLKVGDGALVIERQRVPAEGETAPTPETAVLGEMGKGEFANQTQFLDSVVPADVQVGHLAAHDVSGVALMSDGAAERLVAHDGRQVAGRVGTLLQSLREDRLRRSALTRMFYEDGFCEGSTGDDRSIALLASAFALENVPLPPVVSEPPKPLVREQRSGAGKPVIRRLSKVRGPKKGRTRRK